MPTYYHYTTGEAYDKIIRSLDDLGSFIPSAVFSLEAIGAEYGSGWYVTTLIPSTPTDKLLSYIWGSDLQNRPKSAFWLEIFVHDSYVVFPDSTRPEIALIPFYNTKPSIDDDAINIWGEIPEITLLSGGSRRQKITGKVEVITLSKYPNGRSLWPPSIVGLTGLRGLNWKQREHVRDKYKIEDPNDLLHIEVDKMIDLSDSLYRHNRFEQALKVIERALNIDSNIPIGWSNKGAILAALGRRNDALESYKKAIDLDPTDINAYRNAAASLICLHRHSEAFNMCADGLRIDQNNAELWTNMGLACEALGHDEEAINAYNNAINLDPSIPQIWNNKAALYANKTISLIDKDTHNWQEINDRIKIATQSYCQALKLSPSYIKAKIGLNSIAAIALEHLPYTWQFEDELWHAIGIEVDVFKTLFRIITDKDVVIHPAYIPVLEKLGSNIYDVKELSLVMIRTMIKLATENWPLDKIFTASNDPHRTGACLLSDILGSKGLTKIAVSLGEIASDNHKKYILERGEMLQIAKSLATSGRTMRIANAYNRAIDLYQKARSIYLQCGDRKFAAHMTFNTGVALLYRNLSDDINLGISYFKSSYKEYNDAGLYQECALAKNDAQKIISQLKNSK